MKEWQANALIYAVLVVAAHTAENAVSAAASLLLAAMFATAAAIGYWRS